VANLNTVFLGLQHRYVAFGFEHRWRRLPSLLVGDAVKEGDGVGGYDALGLYRSAQAQACQTQKKGFVNRELHCLLFCLCQSIFLSPD